VYGTELCVFITADLLQSCSREEESGGHVL
jgi:hypothetical protein